jgi:GxxExxY protein
LYHKGHEEHKGEGPVDYAPIPEEDGELARRVIGAAIEVHRLLRPGFLESIYRRALCYELSLQTIPFEYQKELVIPYKEMQIPGLDVLVAGRILLELKTVEAFAPIHQAQLLSHLKATTTARLPYQFQGPRPEGRHQAVRALILCVLCVLCG